MSEILFKTESDITTDWLTYIENEATALSERNDFNIENYIDRELFNPSVKNFLTDNSNIENLSVADFETPLSFRFSEEVSFNAIGLPLRINFKKIKRKIKEVICEVLTNLDDLSGKSMKEIIALILKALIPVFVGGIPAIALPIIIGLIAKILKKGIGKVCA